MEHRRSRVLVLWIALAAVAAAALPGCGGCSRDERTDLEKQVEEQRARRDKARQKAPFELQPLRVQPDSGESTAVALVKPGHWTSASIQAIANQDDFGGRLITMPFPLEGTRYQLGTSRPAVLAKGQPKDLELVLFVPPGSLTTPISVRLLSQDSDRELARLDGSAARMPARQFHMVVLCPEGERYRFLDTSKMYSVRPPIESFGTPEMNYRVVIPQMDHRVALPSHWLTWTSIACTIWDGVEPSALSLDQQQALVDWLHWGGQLIVSGPESLDVLQGSFLAPYLPAVATADVEFGPGDLETFNLHWTRWGKPLNLTRPWPGKRLKPADGEQVRVVAQADNGLPLVVERRVGRGRVVLSAFRLTQRELSVDAWRSFDGFFHACLLGLPPRTLLADPEALEFAPEEAVRLMVRSGGLSHAEVNSRLRILTRDLDRVPAPLAASEANDSALAPLATTIVRSNAGSHDSGVAGWSSFGGVASDARHTLREAAGIYIPEAGFIARLLGVYLLVLVPGNWLVFRLLGRVEWCWIAAPVITLVFALVVVREAQLDIGFARARTDVAVVELQGGYPRAHVTRYTALYTSLATSYDLAFDDPGALVQPFPLFTLDELARQPRLDTSTVYYRSDATGVTLDGFEVRSNALGMLHCEHTLDVGGGIEAATTDDGKLTVRNNSTLSLRDAAVIDGQGRIAWLGDVPAGSAAVPVDFRYADLAAFIEDHPEFAVPADEARHSGAAPETENGINEPENPFEIPVEAMDTGTTLGPATAALSGENAVPAALWRRFAAPKSKDPNLIGSLRLLGFSEEPLPGLRIEPAASQNQQLALVVVNLQYELPAPPVPDEVDPRLREAVLRGSLPADASGP